MSEGIYVIKRPQVVSVRTRSVIQLATIITPFTFTAAENGQVEFVLPSVPAQVVLLSINGAMQNQAAGDFTIVENVITLASGVAADDVVFGIYAEQSTPLVRNLYFVATEGQAIFTLDSAPLAVFSISINGIQQNVLGGDYTIVGKTLTFANSLNAGDKVTGAYQE